MLVSFWKSLIRRFEAMESEHAPFIVQLIVTFFCISPFLAIVYLVYKVIKNGKKVAEEWNKAAKELSEMDKKGIKEAVGNTVKGILKHPGLF